MDAFLPDGITTVDIFTLVAGVAAFFFMVAVWNTVTVRDPMRGRVRALQARRDELRAGFIAPQRRRSSIRRKSQTDQIRNLFSRLKILQSEQAKKIEKKMIRAGWRSRDATVIYAASKLAVPVLAIGVAMFLVFVTKVVGQTPQTRFGVLSGAVFLGFMGPDLFVKNATQKRTTAIRRGLPDALDLMVICAEAGLTLDASLNRVARELGGAYPELADEFSLTAVELGFLQERRQALDNLAERTDLASVRSVVTTLIQTERYGTPLASSLRVLSAEFRNERMMKAEEKAARLPAIMTVPLILFIMPCLFIVLVGPAACRISDQFINR